jgi:pSer/pThr/pTyr-binding forkhead associated (FHA) protein
MPPLGHAEIVENTYDGFVKQPVGASPAIKRKIGASMPKLVVTFKQQIIEAHPLTETAKITIGRHPGNDIVIDNLAVSGYHASVAYGEDSGWMISDLDSKNGTLVNDQKIGNQSLAHKDAITIGKHILLVDLTDEIKVDETVRPVKDGSTALNKHNTMVLESSSKNASPQEESALAEPSRPEFDALTMLDGDDDVIALSGKDAVSIGRNQDADIVVDGLWGFLMGSPAVTISKRAGDYFLRYAGGLIKPKRNGESVRGTIKLNNDDVISVGPVKVRVQLR